MAFHQLKLNRKVTENFGIVTPKFFILPIILILLFGIFLQINNAWKPENYVAIQTPVFIKINEFLSRFPIFELNLTQIGNAFIALSLLSIFFVYAPKLWESLIWTSLFTLVASKILKKIFEMPRPAAILDHSRFKIIGQELVSHDSLPSGHSITIFSIISLLMFAFLPKNKFWKIVWILGFTFGGLFIALTRVALGAHFPLDVLSGCIIGYICAVCGILFYRKRDLWKFLCIKKLYPLWAVIFFGSFIVKCVKIQQEGLFIYFIAAASLLFTIFIIIRNYVQKTN